VTERHTDRHHYWQQYSRVFQTPRSDRCGTKALYSPHTGTPHDAASQCSAKLRHHICTLSALDSARTSHHGPTGIPNPGSNRNHPPGASPGQMLHNFTPTRRPIKSCARELNEDYVYWSTPQPRTAAIHCNT